MTMFVGPLLRDEGRKSLCIGSKRSNSRTTYMSTKSDASWHPGCAHKIRRVQ
jgi:hypothetical protein